MELGSLILKYRKKYDLSQEDLAREVGVTRQTISKWELNETSPDLKQAIKLAEIFNINFNKILTDIDNDEESKKEIQGKIKNIVLIISLSLLIIVLISKISIFFYNYGYNKNHGTIGIICTLNNDEHGYSITFDDTNDIIMVEGSPYVFDNIYDREKHENAIDLITDVSNYFKEKGGYCE